MKRYLVSLAVAGVMAAGPAAGQSVTSANPQTVVAALQGAGYQAELTSKPGESPLIRSGAAGSKFIVFFMGCKEGRNCTTVQFYAGYKANGTATVAKMNEWNKGHRFARAYIDDEGEPVLEMDVNLDVGGMSTALFADHLSVWSGLVGGFRKHIAED